MWRAVFLLPALLAGGCCAEEIDNGVVEKDIVDDLYEIKDQMDNLTDQLREDEHHDGVQLRGKEIEDKLTRIIDEIEKNPPRFKSLKRDAQAQQAKHPRPISEKPPDEPARVLRRIESVIIPEKDSNWWKLRDSRRGEVIQSWGVEIPLRWKARIAAYFISISAEESKYTGK